MLRDDGWGRVWVHIYSCAIFVLKHTFEFCICAILSDHRDEGSRSCFCYQQRRSTSAERPQGQYRQRRERSLTAFSLAINHHHQESYRIYQEATNAVSLSGNRPCHLTRSPHIHLFGPPPTHSSHHSPAATTSSAQTWPHQCPYSKHGTTTGPNLTTLPYAPSPCTKKSAARLNLLLSPPPLISVLPNVPFTCSGSYATIAT